MERDLDQLIAFKNPEELDEGYGIPFTITFIFSLFFLHAHLSDVRLTYL